MTCSPLPRCSALITDCTPRRPLITVHALPVEVLVSTAKFGPLFFEAFPIIRRYVIFGGLYSHTVAILSTLTANRSCKVNTIDSPVRKRAGFTQNESEKEVHKVPTMGELITLKQTWQQRKRDSYEPDEGKEILSGIRGQYHK